MGVLFGILVIAVIGQTILRGSAEASLRGGRRRDREEWRSVACNWHVCRRDGDRLHRRLLWPPDPECHSRQRSFCRRRNRAITRNPESIGGALKKIGGSACAGGSTAHARECALFLCQCHASAAVSRLIRH